VNGKGRPGVTLLVLTAALAGLAAMTFRARSRTADVVVLKLAHGLDTTHPVHQGMAFMAERIAERSAGTLVVQIFPSEQLGSERVLIEQTQMGLIDMTKSSAAALEQFVPRMAVFSVPYIFRDDEHYWSVLRDELGRELLAAGEDQGLVGLCYFDAGSRSFYTKSRPIRTPDDLAGMKIRVQESHTARQMVEQLGGSPTTMAWGELYTSLQQGVVDGAENNPPSFYTSRHYEVCKYYALDEHTQVPDVLLMSSLVWRDLSEEHRRIVQEAADEASEYQRKLWAEKTEEALRAVEAAGVEVLRPDKTPFVEKVRPMHESYRGTAVGQLLERIREH
jgi:tripartite ATP-independent transporter DctP family solute receptor